MFLKKKKKLSQHIRRFVARNKLDTALHAAAAKRGRGIGSANSMAAARLSVGLQAVLVMSLLLLQIMPFLPCTLATGGKSVELLMGRETHEGRHRLLAPSKLIWSRRILVGEPWTGPGKLYLGSRTDCFA